jgi:hypothetical protein
MIDATAWSNPSLSNPSPAQAPHRASLARSRAGTGHEPVEETGESHSLKFAELGYETGIEDDGFPAVAQVQVPEVEITMDKAVNENHPVECA